MERRFCPRKSAKHYVDTSAISAGACWTQDVGEASTSNSSNRKSRLVTILSRDHCIIELLESVCEASRPRSDRFKTGAKHKTTHLSLNVKQPAQCSLQTGHTLSAAGWYLKGREKILWKLS